MDAKFLPTTFEGKLWRFVEEIGEVIAALVPVGCPAVQVQQLLDMHHFACGVGRFGARADLTGAGHGWNNADLLLKRWHKLEASIFVLRRVYDAEAIQKTVRDDFKQVLKELDDLEHAAAALKEELQTRC